MVRLGAILLLRCYKRKSMHNDLTGFKTPLYLCTRESWLITGTWPSWLFTLYALLYAVRAVSSLQLELASSGWSSNRLSVDTDDSLFAYSVSNAGMGMIGPLECQSVKAMQEVFNINFFGLVRLVKEVLPDMKRRRSGHIVVMSSVMGVQGTNNLLLLLLIWF